MREVDTEELIIGGLEDPAETEGADITDLSAGVEADACLAGIFGLAAAFETGKKDHSL
jgi:hypothetical protein